MCRTMKDSGSASGGCSCYGWLSGVATEGEAGALSAVTAVSSTVDATTGGVVSAEGDSMEGSDADVAEDVVVLVEIREDCSTSVGSELLVDWGVPTWIIPGRTVGGRVTTSVMIFTEVGGVD